MLFKNREFRIKMVKTPKDEEDPITPSIVETINLDNIQQLEISTKNVVRQITIAVIGAIIAYKAIDTLSKIAIKKYGR